MNERIFCDYGIEIFKRDGHFFIKYDAGEIVGRFEEVEVSEQEARKAQKSESDAYRVLLKHETAPGEGNQPRSSAKDKSQTADSGCGPYKIGEHLSRR